MKRPINTFSLVATLCVGTLSLLVGPEAFAQMGAEQITLKPPFSKFSPNQSKLPAKPPAGAVMLSGEKPRFVSMKGDQIDWPVEDGALVSTRGEAQPGKPRSNHIASTYHFRDADIHAEFKLPKGNKEGNSGLYLHGNYELQIRNTHDKKKMTQDDMGAVYGFNPPKENAALPPGEWQVYDIRYRAPRRDKDGKITKKGSITAWLNGKKVQDNLPIDEPRSKFHPYRYGTSPYLEKVAKKQRETSTGPLFLQDHDAAVRFRNVWVMPLDDKAGFYEPGKEQKS
ncbi:hypothetical protein Pan216_06760 [Planctomycetes bacterium Pan216]|uniref:3-keto-alpha-glucoside-1,2-lyase/3-keto-2-hydroxy-glucal hydratase domain-containing protein n=1 Tax=Kolteria novifilia TaxID=2527975 RepID=A0A518AYP6_9BACT|nr:hypothetical protein Pan216_06760 [Planctomycetes bacterium Pan216]